jgi:hypothetical protein
MQEIFVLLLLCLLFVCLFCCLCLFLLFLLVLIVVSACSDFACSACAVLFFLLLLLCLLFFLLFFVACGNSEIKRGFERGSQEIKVKSSGNQHSCKRISCSAFAALLAVRLLVFFESTWNSK